MRRGMRVRTLMTAVAIVAIAIGTGLILHRRRERFLALAEWHEAKSVVPITENPDLRIAERAVWHDRMRAKYDRAARYPWLSVAPDPPPPE